MKVCKTTDKYTWNIRTYKHNETNNKNIKYKATKQLYKLRQEIFTSHNPLLHSADSVFTHFSISVMLHSAFTTMVSHHSERSYF